MGHVDRLNYSVKNLTGQNALFCIFILYNLNIVFSNRSPLVKYLKNDSLKSIKKLFLI